MIRKKSNEKRTRKKVTAILTFWPSLIFIIYYIGIKKTVDSKLPYPYNDCKNVINSETSLLVKKILEQNMTYRKINCYDLCIQEYATNNNLTINMVYDNSKFSYEKECGQNCPSECTSRTFDFDQNEIVYEGSSYLRVNFHYVEPKFVELTQIEKTTEADLISNTGGILGLFLEMNFLSVYRFLIYVFDLICFLKWSYYLSLIIFNR